MGYQRPSKTILTHLWHWNMYDMICSFWIMGGTETIPWGKASYRIQTAVPLWETNSHLWWFSVVLRVQHAVDSYFMGRPTYLRNNDGEEGRGNQWKDTKPCQTATLGHSHCGKLTATCSGWARIGAKEEQKVETLDIGDWHVLSRDFLVAEENPNSVQVLISLSDHPHFFWRSEHESSNRRIQMPVWNILKWVMKYLFTQVMGHRWLDKCTKVCFVPTSSIYIYQRLFINVTHLSYNLWRIIQFSVIHKLRHVS